MTETFALIMGRLQPLMGLSLSIARRAASLRVFHFGTVRPVERGTVGEYTLHVQCTWRIEGENGIVTGSADLRQPVIPNADMETWDYDDGNLQDAKLQDWLGGFDEATHSAVNPDGRLIVEAIEADDFGGIALTLSGGFRLVLFPDGIEREDWRLLQPTTDIGHLVIEGGKIVEE